MTELPFSPATLAWFEAAFPGPTPVQVEGWARIAAGEHTLLLAPTGSGKTLAAFLSCLDRLSREEVAPRVEDGGLRVLYVSPLKALVYDIERNLRAPLAGIEAASARLGAPMRPIRVGVRTGDTSQKERQRWIRSPTEVLVTTPESLFLLLSSKASHWLSSVETVIIDEIHAMAGTKRGVHLALSLERLSALCAVEPQRIGLSATQRPVSETARFLGGDRPVSIVDASAPPAMDLEIIVPVADMDHPPPLPEGKVRSSPRAWAASGAAERQPLSSISDDQNGIWPAVQAEVLALVQSHHSTLVFTNSRRLCERLAQRLNELSVEAGGLPLARAHHGSVSHDKRAEMEQALKAGLLPCIVATSSLELGIDMGAIDLVVQIASPGSVSAGLQRVGRAGHQVGGVSVARIFPRHRAELLEAAAVVEAMRQGAIELTHVPQGPLDVLAQQIVGLCLARPWTVDDLYALVRRAAPYRELDRGLLTAVLEMLCGRQGAAAHPRRDGSSEPEAAPLRDLRPRVVWDREADTITARSDARMALFGNAGTIPDRGLYGVFVEPSGPRVGELDEEMVYESRKGDTFLLGASTWRITEIRADRVMVAPAPGESGRMPFWKGEGPGRPVELGRAVGALARRIEEGEVSEVDTHLREACRLDPNGIGNLRALVADQRAAGALPTDRRVVVERSRDELGDWRIAILSPFGGRVHAPWALAIAASIEAKTGQALQVQWTDDGITLRVDADAPLPELELLLPDPEAVTELVFGQLQGSALFAARFREAAARALLLLRRRPGARSPLWAQRLKAQDLLASLQGWPSHPIVLEALRECLRDDFDLPALALLLRQIHGRAVEVVSVEARRPSPFARGLMLSFAASFLYDDDAPLAERRLQALRLDPALLRALLGAGAEEGALDPALLATFEAEQQGTAPDRRARSADSLHDLLRRLGELDDAEVEARAEGPALTWLTELRAAGRALLLGIGGRPRWIAVEDAALYRDALGLVLPGGLPSALLGRVERPLDALVLRWARGHAPFAAGPLARRWGLGEGLLAAVLADLAARGALQRWIPGGPAAPGAAPLDADPHVCCDPLVLRRLKRRALERLRGEVEPVDAAALSRFALRWQGLVGQGVVGQVSGQGHPTTRPAGESTLEAAIARLEGCPLPWSELEGLILPARVPGFDPRALDQLGAAGHFVWVGQGALGPTDGWVALYRREQVARLLKPEPYTPPSPLHAALLDAVRGGAAAFQVDLHRRVEHRLGRQRGEDVSAALWALVWAGQLTNDTVQPLIGLSGPRRGSATGGRWSAVSDLLDPALDREAQGLAVAEALIARLGLITREGVAVESLPLGWGALYPVLSTMEEAGKLRRGWFVGGLGGAQFASPGAVDRLREAGVEGELHVLSAVDPAQLWGGALPWPEGPPSPRRAAGALVVLRFGAPVIVIEKGGRAIVLFERAAGPLREAVAALGRWLGGRRCPPLELEKIDGVEVSASPDRALLVGAGLEPDRARLRLGRAW
jgi:ATP-dependent Lhr-like helicase